MTQPCELSAVEARKLMQAGEMSPVELLESCLSRIAAVNGAVNAVVAMDEDRARRDALAAEKGFRAGDTMGPLAGLPVGIKDLNATAGLRTTYGSLIHKDNVPEQDEALVARLRDAGAIVLAKTNTPEFGVGSNTTNKVYGPTRNPYDPERTPGGSSGGSAAALATGNGVLAKPAEQTPLTALAIAEACLEAELPPGVFNVVTGDPQAIGEVFLGDERVRKISFTGSTEVGRLLLRGAAEAAGLSE